MGELMRDSWHSVRSECHARWRISRPESPQSLRKKPAWPDSPRLWDVKVLFLGKVGLGLHGR
ncbi:Uncharacterized protein FKW44_024809 [Caligus rogercresseyi]|uniref:Uncharacterized protein n=1 Tax=Caligus rogercresseyi TaxID=217165 RepID=A0A7T8GM75_CALRO|nr:Uncharacterized protein FKW44_024809 [Caligus rogercresseyi]